MLPLVTAFGWFCTMCILQAVIFRGDGRGTHDFGLATLIPAWLTAIAWSAAAGFPISKRLFGITSLSGFILGGPLSILLSVGGSYLMISLGMTEDEFAALFQPMFNVLALGGLLGEGRPGTAAGLAFWALCIFAGMLTGLLMTFRRDIRAILLVGLISFVYLSVPRHAYSYGETVHLELLTTDAALLLHNTAAPGNYREMTLKLPSMRQGTIDEDGSEFGLVPKLRNHFYNPSNAKGILGFESALEKIVNRRIYETAVSQYKNSRHTSLKDGAYFTFGHVLHLVSQDMHSAPHVHNDIHFTLEDFGGPTFAPNSYETWTSVNVNLIQASPLRTASIVPAISGPIGAALHQNASTTFAATRFEAALFKSAATPAAGELGTMFPSGHPQHIRYVPQARCALDNDGLCIMWEDKWELTGVGDCFEFSGCAASPSAGDEWWQTLPLTGDNPSARYFYIEDSAIAIPRNYRGQESGGKTLAELWALGHQLPDRVIGEQLIAKGQAASAGLMKRFAKDVDPLVPDIIIHNGDTSSALIEGDLIPHGGYTHASQVFIEGLDPVTQTYPTAAGIYRLVLAKLDASGTVTDIELPEGRERDGHLFPVSAGEYGVTAYDGLGNTSTATFRVVDTPPNLTLTNADGERLTHGTISENAMVHVAATHNPAPVRSVEFFIETTPDREVFPFNEAVDVTLTKEFRDNAWHYVRTCDVALNCTYSLFGVFPPGSAPHDPPGPPSPCKGCRQRPNVPNPPAWEPTDLPPPPPSPVPPGPPNPPCRGEQCLKEPPGPIPPWDPEPRKRKFCERTPQNCNIPIAFPHDPNAKHGPSGSVDPGQTMTYTIEFENEGEGLALETFVKDILDPSLDDTTLVLRDMKHVNYLAETEAPANYPYTYDSRTRTLTVQTGDAAFRQGGRFILEAKLKPDTAPGTMITNAAVVHFPNSLEVTPTNVIVSAVPHSTVLAYEGATSAIYGETASLAARLTAGGQPLTEQPVDVYFAGTTRTIVTDGTGFAQMQAAVDVAPGTYEIQVSYEGDGLLYSPAQAAFEFVVTKRPVQLQAPIAAASSTETVRLSVTLTDQGAELTDLGTPRSVRLELIPETGPAVPVATTLLSGATGLFEFSMPSPLQIVWGLRASFEGDARYAPVFSEGVLRLIEVTPPTAIVLAPEGGRTYSAAEQIPIDFFGEDEHDPAPIVSAILASASGLTIPVTDGTAVAASSLSSGTWRLVVQAWDWAGNTIEVSGEPFQVLAVPDALAPKTIVYAGQPSVNADTIFITSSSSMGLIAVDDLAIEGDGAGVGVERTEYSLDGAPSLLYNAPFTVSTEGAHLLTFFSADFAGNVETAQTRTLVVDHTAPVTWLAVAGSTVASSSVTVTTLDVLSFAAEDAASGVAQTTYEINGSTSVSTSTFTLTPGVHTLTFRSVDNLGNAEATNTSVVTVRPPGPGAVAVLEYPGPAALEVEKALGGVVSAWGQVNGQTWTLQSAPGKNADTGFTAIASGLGATEGELTQWNTAGLSGHHTLRLSADDGFGGMAVSTANVFIGAPVYTFTIGSKDSHAIVPGLKDPTGIVVRQDGKLWVAGTKSDRLLLITPEGAVAGESLKLKNPQGLALDAAGNVYVADKGKDKVYKLTPDGSSTLMTIGSGLKQPWDVAVDANGDVYVADDGHNRVKVYSSSGDFLRDLGEGVLLSTSGVRGLALTAEGVWITDKEQERLFLLSRSGQLLASLGDAEAPAGELSRTRGLASDSLGAVYVVERNRDRVQKFDPRGRGLIVFGSRDLAAPAERAAKSYLKQPFDAAVGPDGALWVTDAGRDRLVRYALPVQGYAPASAGRQGSADGEKKEARLVDARDGGHVLRDDGTGVRVPEGALQSDLEITVESSEGQDTERKNAKRAERRVQAASEEIEYGPHGTVFASPVTLTLAYSPLFAGDEDALKVHYWNPSLGDWEPLASTVDKRNKTVSAQTSHFSLYQVLAPGGPTLAAAEASFGLREVFAFPNPARGGAKPTLHVAVGVADKVTVRIFDAAGREVRKTESSGGPSIVDGRYAYEFVWDGHIPSGVYLYVVEAEKAGHAPIRKTGRMAVVR